MATSLLSQIKTTENIDMMKKLKCSPLVNLGNILSQVGAEYNAIIKEFVNMQNELEKARLKEKQLISQLDSFEYENQKQQVPKEFITRDNELKRNSHNSHKKFKTPEKNGMSKLQKVVRERDNLVKEVHDKNVKVEPLSPVSMDLNLATISDTAARREILTPVSKESSSQSSVEIISTEEEFIHINNDTSEIDGTPTGRISPIIGLRRPKNKYGAGLLDSRNQQIFEDDCHSSTLKERNRSTSLKQRRNTKLKQSRLPFSNNQKSKSILDVSTSKLFDGGRRTPLLGKLPQIECMKGSTEDEDVILPSPTSDHIKIEQLSGSSYKFFSPRKSMKTKNDCRGDEANVTPSFEKFNHYEEDMTYVPGYSPHCMDIDNSNPKTPIKAESPRKLLSPKKEKRSPLSLNNNAVNVLPRDIKDADRPTDACCREPVINSSLSILTTRTHTANDENGRGHSKAKTGNNRFLTKEPEPQFIYKEAPVRKQAEKRQLPGWSCRECKEYYGEAYKDDEDKLFEAMQRCSRHRGRFNPERQQTPPGFWDVRMSVPDDTQELNRRNNAM